MKIVVGILSVCFTRNLQMVPPCLTSLKCKLRERLLERIRTLSRTPSPRGESQSCGKSDMFFEINTSLLPFKSITSKINSCMHILHINNYFAAAFPGDRAVSPATPNAQKAIVPDTVHDESSISLGDLSDKMQNLDIKGSRARQTRLCGDVADGLSALASGTSTPLSTKNLKKATKDAKGDATFFLSFPCKIKSPDRTDKSQPYLKRNAVDLFGTAGVPTISQVQQGKLNKWDDESHAPRVFAVNHILHPLISCYLCCAMLLLAEHFPQELKKCITEQDEHEHVHESSELNAGAKKNGTRRFRVRLYSKSACNTRTGGTVERRNDVLVTDEFYTYVHAYVCLDGAVVRKHRIKLFPAHISFACCTNIIVVVSLRPQWPLSWYAANTTL